MLAEPHPRKEEMASNHPAEIKFFDPRASKKALVEKIPKWRGDHRGCSPGHHTGECVAPGAWMIQDKTWEILPAMAGVSIEPNMLGTVQDLSKKGAYAEPVWKTKGWLDPEEARGVRPSDEVVKFLVDGVVEDRRVNLDNRKAEYETVVRECKQLREAIEKAHAKMPQKARPSDG